MLDTLLLKALIVIGVAAAFAGGMARLRLPLIMGYLATGFVIGPFGFNVLPNTAQTEFLAELGVIFLMFMVGLEFRLTTLVQSYRHTLLPGFIQVCLATSIGMLAGLAFGFEMAACTVLGGAVAMSSTALVTKQLDERGEIDDPHARMSVRILVFQDLASLPFLVLVGTYRIQPFRWPEFVLQLAISATAFLAIAWLATPVFRRLVATAARLRSNELLILTAVALAIGTSVLLHVLGLSTAIGAFLAGMALGESDYRHQVADGVKPIRDLLVGLFFVTIGMSVDPMSAARSPLIFLAVLCILIPGKFAATFLSGLTASWHTSLNIRTALILAQGGEIGLLLMTQAINQGVIAGEAAQPVLVAIVLSMALAALIIQHHAKAVVWVRRRHSENAKLLEIPAIEASLSPKNHIILCGVGRVGRLVAKVLEMGNVPYVAIERDQQCIHDANTAGRNIIFGDASRRALLEAAGIAQARALVISFDHRRSVERIIHFAREANPEIPLVVSVREDGILRDLATSRTIFLPENLAAGFQLATEALLSAGLERSEATALINRAKASFDPVPRSSAGASIG